MRANTSSTVRRARCVCGDDLWLAQACEQARPAAWDALAHEYTPRLTGLAIRRGLLAAGRDAVRRYLEQRPGEALGLATRACLERRLPGE